MSVDKVSSTNSGVFNVYVRLLEEGTLVYRPVPATKERDGVCVLGGYDFYDECVEIWEFKPGTLVSYELRKFDEGVLPVATSIQDKK